MNTFTYTFNCVFVCAITGQTKDVVKEYTACNYLDAKKGLRQYFEDNKAVKELLELEDLTLQTCLKDLSK